LSVEGLDDLNELENREVFEQFLFHPKEFTAFLKTTGITLIPLSLHFRSNSFYLGFHVVSFTLGPIAREMEMIRV
jgi:hypothetical protein